MQLINLFLNNLMAMVAPREEREEGQTLVEYALIIALISLLVVALAALLQDPLTNTFQSIADALTSSGS
jgi:pilus assembly protein Flp/PilA